MMNNCFDNKDEARRPEIAKHRLEIAKHLKIADPSILYVFGETDSTNSRARELALNGAAQGTAVVADSQTSGRGRMGRKFESPEGKGIYLSVILRPDFSAKTALFTTTAAAVAVSEAIFEETGKKAGIKWVNDIYIGQKKVCGILAEAEANPKTSRFEFIILGIGVNFNTENSDFSDSVIKRGAGAIYESEKPAISREKLTAAIIDKVALYCIGLNGSKAENKVESEVESKIESMRRMILEKYRSSSIVIGRKIRCIRGGEEWIATAKGIGDNGELLTVREDGSSEILSSGEISIRPVIS